MSERTGTTFLAWFRWLRTIPMDALFLPWSGLQAPRRIALARLDAELPLGFAERGRDVEITIPPSAVLWREIVLPRKARRKAQAAIAMNLRQTMPAQGRGLHWRAAPARAEGDRLRYPVLIAKADQIADLSRAIERRGGRLLRVIVEGPPPVLFFEDDRAARPRTRWLMVATAIVAFGLVAQIGLLQWRIQLVTADNASLAAEIGEMETEAIAIRATLEAQDEVARSLRADLARFDAGRRFLPLLAGLTLALPDDVWISEMSGRGGTLVVAGFAKRDVTEVVAAVARIAGVVGVKLNGPVTVDTRTGDRRFEMAITVEPGGS